MENSALDPLSFIAWPSAVFLDRHSVSRPPSHKDGRGAIDLGERAQDLPRGGANGAREAVLVAHVEPREAPEERPVEDVTLRRQRRPLRAPLAPHPTEGARVHGSVVRQRVHQDELPRGVD